MNKKFYKHIVWRSCCFLLPIMFGLLATSCTTQYDKLLKSTDHIAKYNAAKEYYAAEKYRRAYTLFEQVAIYFRSLPQDDSVNFYLAKSYYNSKDIYSAEYYFRQFGAHFPRSPFAEEANYLYIVSLYSQTLRYELDQSPSYRTLSAITDFFYIYPQSKYMEECHKIREDLTQRLDEKQFEAAKLYYTTRDYKSAITALQTSLKDFPESRYKEETRYYLVASAYEYATRSYRHRQKDRYQAVVDEYYNFVSEFPESKYRKEVEKMNEEVAEQIRLLQATPLQKEEVITLE